MTINPAELPLIDSETVFKQTRPPLFATVQIEDGAAVHDASVPAARKAVRPRPGQIIVEISDATVRVPNGVDPATLGVLIQALRGGS